MLTVNGEPVEIEVPCTLQELLDHLQLGSRKLAVEINGEIIPRSAYAGHALYEGDRIEVVQAIGGG